MKYYFEKITSYTFDEAIEKITDELKKEGFGILTEVDVQATLKKKLDVDFRKYKILGACNPPYAYKTLQAELDIGLMLPCNVVVMEMDDGKVRVSAIDPKASMMAVGNPELDSIAGQVQKKLEMVINNL